jgi:3-methyladenine DNA glycosylase/8-oxoguanine DNA glycosylase
VPRPGLDEASLAVAAVSPVMARLHAEHGPYRPGRPERAGERFEGLANSITYQQLAGSAASVIWGRVRALVDGPFTPEAVAAVDIEALRGAGLSGAKARSIHDLAAHVADGRVRLERIGRRSDEAVIAELTQVWGIGTWTAQMFLMFTLRRLDVWPVGDLGVRAGWARAHDLAEVPGPAELEELGAVFRPYRSVAAWYCWRVADTKVPTI